MATCMQRVAVQLSRLALLPSASSAGPGLCRHITTQTYPLLFRITAPVCAEPLKKKKRLDPAIQQAKEVRRKKKLERELRRLDRFGRKLKPVDEIEKDIKLSREIEHRKREQTVFSTEELEARILLQKDWTRYKQKQNALEMAQITVADEAQQRALNDLREVSEELYMKAIQVDPDFLPYAVKGPTLTPAVKEYDSPDGDYVDITKTFDH